MAVWITNEIRVKLYFDLKDSLRYWHVLFEKLDCHCSWGWDVGGI